VFSFWAQKGENYWVVPQGSIDILLKKNASIENLIKYINLKKVELKTIVPYLSGHSPVRLSEFRKSGSKIVIESDLYV
jgi:hypothetical protein